MTKRVDALIDQIKGLNDKELAHLEFALVGEHMERNDRRHGTPDENYIPQTYEYAIKYEFTEPIKEKDGIVIGGAGGSRTASSKDRTSILKADRAFIKVNGQVFPIEGPVEILQT